MSPLTIVGILVISTSTFADVKHVIEGSAHPPDPQAVNHLATNPPYWWMSSNSPLKAAYDYYKKCNAKGNCLAPINPAAPSPQPFQPQIDVKKNPFLNGNFQQSAGTANFNDKIDIKKNPFLSGAVVTTGSGVPLVKDENGFIGVQPAQPFKKPGFATTHPLEQKKKPGFATTHPLEQKKPGVLNVTVECKGAGFACVEKQLCLNGVVNSNGEGLLQVRSNIRYCHEDTEVCCQMNNLNEITAGKSSVPVSTIKFGGGSGFSPGLIHVQPLNLQPDITFGGEHGHHSSSSTSKSIRDTSLSPSTVDYSDTKFDSDVRFASTFQGPAYLPPVAPTSPAPKPSVNQEFVPSRPSTSFVQPTTPPPYRPQPTTLRPAPPSTSREYLPPRETTARPSVTPQQPYQPSVTPQRPYQPSVTPQRPYQPSVTPQQTYPSVTTQRPYQPSVTTQRPYQPSVSPQQPYQPSVTPQRPSVTPQQPYQPSVTPQQPYQPSVTPQRPSVTPQQPYQPSVTPQRPYQPSVTPQQPYQPSVTPQRPSVTPQQPYQPSVTPQQPYQPSVTPQRPYQPSVTPQQPYQPSATPQRPYQPSVTTQRPYQPSVTTRPYQPSTPQQPYQPSVTPQQPYQPSVTPQQPQRPYQPSVTPQQPYQPSVTPQQPQRPYQPSVTPQQPYQPSVTPQRPYQPSVTPQQPYQPSVTPQRPYQPAPSTPRPYQPTTSREYLPPRTTQSVPQPSSPRPNPFVTQPTTPRPTYTAPSQPRPPPTTPRPVYTTSESYPSPSSPPFRPTPSVPRFPSPSTPGYQYPSPQQPSTQRPYQPTQRPTPGPSTVGGYEYPKPTPTFGYPSSPRPDFGNSNVNNQYIPPPRPTKRPGENPDQIGDSDSIDETQIKLQTPRPEVPNELPPPAGCAAALKCVQEIYCTAEGVISPVPVVLTKEQELLKVPTTECQDTDSGIIGKCCRDPNYKDPWPSANLVDGVDDGQYKEDANLGQYQPDLQRNVRSDGGTNVAASCGERHANTKPLGVGPLDVNFAEIPWQAMVLRDSNRSLLCGGVIVRRDAVLTAAHCVEGLETSDILIKGGEWKLGIDEEPLPFQIVKVAVVVRHPQYQKGSFVNDLALLVLEEKLRLSKNIGTLCLPPPNQIPTKNCIATGWGKRILQLHAKGAIMHAIDVKIMDNQQCQETLTNTFQHAVSNYSPNTLCGYSDIDQCRVDYGSALACSDGGSYTLSGIFAWDTGCKQPGQIGGYIAPDVEWIESTLSKPIKQLKALNRN